MPKDQVQKLATAAEIEVEPGYDDITAQCTACGEEHVGVGTEVYLMVPGMLMPSREYDVPVFIPDPDAKIRVLKMPNGTLGFVTDQETTKYSHKECIDQLIEDAGCEPELDEDDDDDDDSEDG